MQRPLDLHQTLPPRGVISVSARAFRGGSLFAVVQKEQPRPRGPLVDFRRLDLNYFRQTFQNCKCKQMIPKPRGALGCPPLPPSHPKPILSYSVPSLLPRGETGLNVSVDGTACMDRDGQVSNNGFFPPSRGNYDLLSCREVCPRPQREPRGNMYRTHP
ncbi:hypothetical protein LX36DRAFT_302213 [Colletotrichum falcatum]|nr:hypothetical protein LX36DRAFT_302213 [Colletotrichum falcatum]